MNTRRIARRAMLGTSLALLLVTAVVQPMSARTRYVDGDGRAGPAGCASTEPAFRRVQGAIDASVLGDTVLVCPGTYTEALVVRGHGFGPSSPPCSLGIRGIGGRTPVIRAPRTLSPAAHEALVVIRDLPDICGGTVRLTNLRLRPHGGPGSCWLTSLIDVFDASLRMRDTTLSAPRALPTGCNTYLDGIRFQRRGHGDTYAHLDVAGSTFRDFEHRGIDAGPTFGSISLRGNVFVQTGISSGQGTPFAIQSEAPGVVANNVIATDGQPEHGAVGGIRSALSMTIEGNRLELVEWGIRSAGADRIVGNTLLGAPTSSRDGIRVTSFQGDAPGRIIDNRVRQFQGRGLLVLPPPSGDPARLVIRSNRLAGNDGVDCMDRTSGQRTAGTADTWIDNIGDESSPAGLCQD